MGTFGIIILIIIIIVSAKFFYGSYLTNITDKNFETYRKSDPIGAAKIDPPKTQDGFNDLVEALDDEQFKKTQYLNDRKEITQMTEMENILNYGPGSPGETTRVITELFMKFRTESRLSDNDICRNILEIRASNYSEMGFEIIDNEMIDKIIARANGKIPFIAFADVFLSNNQPLNNNADALIENLDLIIKVIVNNYNSLVSASDKIVYINVFKANVKYYLEDEFGYIFSTTHH